MTSARDIMTDSPIIVDVDLGVVDIAKILEAESIGAVIVCDSDRRLQGMVTDRDLAVGVLAAGRDPSSTVAGDLLSGREVVTIGADDSVEEALTTMKEHAVRRLPVVDGHDIVGIVSQADLARQSDNTDVGGMVEVISQSDDNTARG